MFTDQDPIPKTDNRASLSSLLLKLDKSLINPISSESLNQAAKRPLVTGFVIEKAKNQLGYQPVDFLDGIAIMDKQIKKYEI